MVDRQRNLSPLELEEFDRRIEAQEEGRTYRRHTNQFPELQTANVIAYRFGISQQEVRLLKEERHGPE